MNKNSRFSVAPASLNLPRSTCDIPYRHLTTANFGTLVPFFWQEILPGDTFDVNTRMFSRMSTPLYPVMDNAFVDYYYFFVPNRLVWSRWPEFLGENKYSAWASEIDYIIPHGQVTPVPGGLYDHLGVPTYQNGLRVDIGMLLPRAYQLIWSEWFRNENTTDPILVNTGDDFEGADLEADVLLKVSKPFDYFTSALPAPQKGDAIDIPFATGLLPVVTRSDTHTDSQGGIHFEEGDGPWKVGVDSFGNLARVDIDGTGPVTTLDDGSLTPDNLWVNADTASGVTINQLRQAFAMQRLLELQARTGSRYTEIIKASFGVTSPDARLQRPEYLGGKRVNIQMQQVAQQSVTTEESPLGRLGAYSKTVSANKDFSKSFTEHGFIVGVMCARTVHTYQQGLHPMWSRRGRYDVYWPTFANIGEQPIRNKQIYYSGDLDQDNAVFGYQEAWAEYRYKPNEVTGAFRSTVDNNLDEWHYADYYEDLPILSPEWMEETAVNVDRTLAVQSSLHDQLLFDIRVDMKASRVMPLYSIPGLQERF